MPMLVCTGHFQNWLTQFQLIISYVGTKKQKQNRYTFLLSKKCMLGWFHGISHTKVKQTPVTLFFDKTQGSAMASTDGNNEAGNTEEGAIASQPPSADPQDDKADGSLAPTSDPNRIADPVTSKTSEAKTVV